MTIFAPGVAASRVAIHDSVMGSLRGMDAEDRLEQKVAGAKMATTHSRVTIN
jgi:hypothetical protein